MVQSRYMLGWVTAAMLILACGSTAYAIEASISPVQANQEELASLKQHNVQIVANTPQAVGVFLVRDDGSIEHIQSGMTCPASFPNVAFWHAEVFSSPAGSGTDVGCDYGRNGADGKWVSKLTIFATKAPLGTTLDSAFSRYEGELKSTYPDAVTRPASLTIGKDKSGSAVAYRATGYSASSKTGVHTHEELIVGLVGDWMLEVRASYPHEGIIVKDANDKTDLKNQLFDIQSPYLAFLAAEESLKSPAAGKSGRN